jgi:hypothetical protein
MAKTHCTPREAIEMLKKKNIKTTMMTFLSWVRIYDLGHKVKGRWIIFPDKVERFMRDNFRTGKIHEKKKD